MAKALPLLARKARVRSSAATIFSPAPGAPNARAGLAHRRLTVIDLSDDSAQPMVDATRRFVLVYNGELYNYVELRRELESGGKGAAHVRRHRGGAPGMDAVGALGSSSALLACGPSRSSTSNVGRWSYAATASGSRPCSTQRSRGALLFASEIKGLLAAIPTPEPHDATVAGLYHGLGTDTGLQNVLRRRAPSPAPTCCEVSLDDPGTHPG